MNLNVKFNWDDEKDCEASLDAQDQIQEQDAEKESAMNRYEEELE